MGDAGQNLREGDPRQLGGFRLVGRTRESPLGVVYLGRNAAGVEASVVMLNSGAATDPTARERFARAVQGRDDVLAARTRGRSALWAALPVDTDGPGPGSILEETARGGPVAAHGPVVQPYWAHERRGSVVLWAPWRGGRGSAVAAGEGNWWPAAALGVLLLLLLCLAAALLLWLSRFPRPEIPDPGQTVDVEQGESEAEQEPGSQEGEGSEAPVPRPDGEEESQVPAPTPDDGVEGDPEDNV